jgi:hypothetical protein
MKKYLVLTLFSFLLFHVTLSAQSVYSGSLQVIYSGNENVRMELNGPFFFNEPFINNIILSGLLPGNYTLKIYLDSRRGQTILNERIRITSQRRSIINIQRNGQFSMRTGADQNSIVLNTDYNNRYPQNGPIIYNQQPLSNYEFAELSAALKKAPFDKDKLNILSVSSAHSFFYTDQIREIMKIFSFDDGRLDCAKILSSRTIDPQNLYSLADAFSFISTRDKFYEYLNINRNGNHY